MSVYENVKDVAENALRRLREEGKEYVSARELLDWVKDHESEFDVDVDAIAKSWGAYLTKASNDEQSRINREPGEYGYVLGDTVDNKKGAVCTPVFDKEGALHFCLWEFGADRVSGISSRAAKMMKAAKSDQAAATGNGSRRLSPFRTLAKRWKKRNRDAHAAPGTQPEKLG